MKPEITLEKAITCSIFWKFRHISPYSGVSRTTFRPPILIHDSIPLTQMTFVLVTDFITRNPLL